MKNIARLLLMAVPVVMLMACSSTGDQAPSDGGEMMDGTAAAPQEQDRETMQGIAVPEASGFAGHPLDDPNSLLAKRVIYFDFDSDTVKDQFSSIIEAHAAYLADHPRAMVTLEGHGDERGTREYNMALGERRANAVRQFLMLQGANAGQLEVISYGEERPVALGHDEDSWRLNRRVELIYTSR